MNNIQRLLHKLETQHNTVEQSKLCSLLMVEICYHIFRIQLCLTSSQADSLFDMLDEAQATLAKLSNRRQILLPLSLQQFVIDFDNLHDQNMRRQLFENINKNYYVYGDPWNALSKILDDIEQKKLDPRLARAQQQLITEKIQGILKHIFSCIQLTDAEAYFAELATIQNLLSLAVFKYDIEVDQPLMQFIRDCERLDDLWTRTNLFKRIKEGTYNLFPEIM